MRSWGMASEPRATPACFTEAWCGQQTSRLASSSRVWKPRIPRGKTQCLSARQAAHLHTYRPVLGDRPGGSGIATRCHQPEPLPALHTTGPEREVARGTGQERSRAYLCTNPAIPAPRGPAVAWQEQQLGRPAFLLLARRQTQGLRVAMGLSFPRARSCL